MRDTQYTRVVIISAELDTITPRSNAMRTFELEEELESANITFSTALGSYHGIKEVSFVCTVKDIAELNRLQYLAFDVFDQESILFQDTFGDAKLLYSDKEVQELGKLRQVSKQLAETGDNYTLMNGEYYAIVA